MVYKFRTIYLRIAKYLFFNFEEDKLTGNMIMNSFFVEVLFLHPRVVCKGCNSFKFIFDIAICSGKCFLQFK